MWGKYIFEFSNLIYLISLLFMIMFFTCGSDIDDQTEGYSKSSDGQTDKLYKSVFVLLRVQLVKWLRIILLFSFCVRT